MERYTKGVVFAVAALALTVPEVLAQAVTGAGVTDTMFYVRVGSRTQARLAPVSIGYPTPVFYLQSVQAPSSTAVAQVAFGIREQYVAEDRLQLDPGVVGTTGPNETILTLTASEPVTFDLVLAGTVSSSGTTAANGRAFLDFGDDGSREVDVQMGSNNTVRIPVNMTVGTLVVRTHTALHATAGAGMSTAASTASVLLAFQAASYSPLGSGCTGTGGVPTMSPQGGQRAWAGEIFTVDVINLPTAPALGAVGILGGSHTFWGAVPLPANLTPFGMTGCTARVSVDFTQPLSNTAGTATWSFPIPAWHSIVGSHFYQQILVLDPNANGLGLTLSNASDATIGTRNN